MWHRKVRATRTYLTNENHSCCGWCSTARYAIIVLNLNPIVGIFAIYKKNEYQLHHKSGLTLLHGCFTGALTEKTQLAVILCLWSGLPQSRVTCSNVYGSVSPDRYSGYPGSNQTDFWKSRILTQDTQTWFKMIEVMDRIHFKSDCVSELNLFINPLTWGAIQNLSAKFFEKCNFENTAELIFEQHGTTKETL